MPKASVKTLDVLIFLQWQTKKIKFIINSLTINLEVVVGNQSGFILLLNVINIKFLL